ncbi:SPFH/Band 7/PHB domain protein [uncultured virus]|nr:SPFH/Band 7/PHB domain protein [uncultured virus]
MQENNSLLINEEEDDSNDFQPSRIRNEPFYGKFLDCLGNLFGCLCIPITCGTLCNPYKSVSAGERGVIQRFGSIKKIVDDGLHYVNPVTENLIKIDVKIHVKQLCQQQIITRDKLAIKVDGCVFYKVSDVRKSIFGVHNVSDAVDKLAHGTLRDVIGQHSLQDCLEKKQSMASVMKNIVASHAEKWGVIIEDIQINDITIPSHIQEMLSSSAVAESECQAKLKYAQTDVITAKMLREAADQLNTPAAMQMRILDSYRMMISENPQATKVIFLPMDYKHLDTFTSTVLAQEEKK